MLSAKKITDLAKDARELAQAKYSNFKVGAAVETASGKIYTGNNIESSSYGLTICAERVAIFKAVSEGDLDIVSIGIVADTKGPVAPCGACRQILIDYARDAKVHLANMNGDLKSTTSKRLLPHFFNEDDLS